jgi:hypothetical protein
VLRLAGEQVESLFDEALPIEVRELPADLSRLDALLSDPGLLAPIWERWETTARDRGRPTIAMSLFVRLMVVKRRSGWGYVEFPRFRGHLIAGSSGPAWRISVHACAVSVGVPP